MKQNIKRILLMLCVSVCFFALTACSGAADTVADAAGVRGAVAQALDMLASKRAVRLAKKHGNITL